MSLFLYSTISVSLSLLSVSLYRGVPLSESPFMHSLKGSSGIFLSVAVPGCYYEPLMVRRSSWEMCRWDNWKHTWTINVFLLVWIWDEVVFFSCLLEMWSRILPACLQLWCAVAGVSQNIPSTLHYICFHTDNFCIHCSVGPCRRNCSTAQRFNSYRWDLIPTGEQIWDSSLFNQSVDWDKYCW